MTMMAVASEGPRERARQVGIEALGDGELLALLLGTGAPDAPVLTLAASILAAAGGLVGLSRAGLGDLAQRRGVGFAKAARIVAALELGRRCASASVDMLGVPLSDSESVNAWARPRFAGLDHEELWVLALDGRNHLRAARRVAQGGLHGLTIQARDALRVALREGASSFILVHNHPSGDPTPSPQDIEFTRAVARGADAVNTPFLDHVVVARRGFVSMLDRGLIEILGP
jgi:DNA repair protein RadC